MEIHEAVSFYHSRAKYVTLQELLANNMQSLIRDLTKIFKQPCAIKKIIKFELSCTINIALHTSNT